LRDAAGGGPVCLSLSGLTSTAKALYTALLWQATERPLVVVVEGNKQAESFFESLETFFDLLASGRALPRPQLLPALDVLPSRNLSPHAEISEQRAIGLWRLASQRVPVTVVPVAAALLRGESADFYRQLALTLRPGDEVPLGDLLDHLQSIGYDRREPVEMVGEYSVRGGILDVFPPESGSPFRIEFFGDQIESMRRFDVETQRSVLKTGECALLPLLEFPKSRRVFSELGEHLRERGIPFSGEPEPGWEFLVPLIRPRSASILNLLERPIVLLDEPAQIRAAAESLWKRLEGPGGAGPQPAQAPSEEPVCLPEQIFFRMEEFDAQLADTARILLSELDLTEETIVPGPSPRALHIATYPSMAFHGNMPVAVAEARTLVDAGHRVVFFAASTGELERLADIFQEYAVPYQLGVEPTGATPEYLAGRAYMAGSVASIYIVKGRVRRGVVFPEAQLAIVGSEDLFETSELLARPAAGKPHLAMFSTELVDLQPGDYVVHVEHGIGRFVGLREIAQGDHRGDYMLLEYAGETKLYVPLTRMDLVQRFRGSGEAAPQLDRLGGATWERTKKRVKARMRDMADELLKLYAQRKMVEGFPFSADSGWQKEFEDAFEFSETKDQVTAIRDIKRDMETPQPMDRLLCGDVGFGKTEVAMRAAFKALGDGKQVAVLAPTTVLCFQHYETFKRRFASFPVRVEMLSRFRSRKELKEVVADLAAGKVDIVIGTHRLISKDVEFRDLGLLVVDEEQRFGVGHKERLKQMRKNVDVLTMTATPIPRTLHMSMVGLRDMSVIETPPKDRLAIQTVVARFQPELIRSAIEQELSRGGQVYFVHNHIDTIWNRAAAIQELVPQCSIIVGHGQMPEGELEKVMIGFVQHKYDVLACTTIIENGLDIPLANTIIIDHAERYGLSELYQLRGRVGRSNRRAYAYLLVPPDTELSEIAKKRLAALREFSDLGSGFKIAALDLELRGAGNLLGGEQHGHINAVGFDTYTRLLEETVMELKGEEVPLEIHSRLNLGLDIRIPPEYIADEHQRLRAYKRISDAGAREAPGKILAELEDRYGPAPGAVNNLLEFATLKSLSEKLGIESIERRQSFLNLKFHKESKVDTARLMALVAGSAGAQFTPAGVLRLPTGPDIGPAGVLRALKDKLLALS
jgi:transcription-repair coupling factor (superfamily II helicase)